MQMQENLRRESEMLESIFEDTSMLIMVLDINGNVVEFNHAAETLTGYSKEELIENRIAQTLLPEAQREEIHRVFCDILSGKALKDIEVTLQCKDGSNKTIILNNTLIHNQKGEVQGVVSVGMDMSERRNMEKNLHNLAYYDVLTKLPNRTLFEQQLKQYIVQAESQHSKLAVIYIDIDNFKNINDTIGHSSGDKFLMYVASILAYHIKAPNVVARLSGDEFGILLTNGIEDEQIETKVNNIFKFLRRPWVLEKQQFFISVSIGIALYPEHGKDSTVLMQNADTAMFHIKGNGKDGYCYYNDYMKEKTWNYIQMNARLINAIKNEEFLLYYQPQIDLKTNKITGVEALIRWIHPEKGFIPPMEFIPFAEETGHIHSISRWVLKTACNQNKTWKEKGYEHIKIAVNLSGKTLTQKNLVQHIQQTLQQYHINPHEMELEITETAVIADINHSVDILNSLKQLGLIISLDDFGTGYSSLTYLKKLPIDILKMDREFIKNIVSEDEECFIVKTVIELAHNMGLKVVAEGIETKEQLEVLRKSGCDIAQGYYFSKPVPALEIEELFKVSY
jgi:diguanylate cyclase (GGDEF)-like protein/PAS domain S-box-containing protein